MSYPYQKNYDYFVSFSAGKDSALMLADLIRAGVPTENIFLFIYDMSPKFSIHTKILEFYNSKFKLFKLKTKADETELKLFIENRKSVSGNVSIFLRGDADHTFKFTCLNHLGVRLGCDICIAPELLTPYAEVWQQALDDSTEFVILSVLFTADASPEHIESTKASYVGKRMNAAEYYSILVDNTGVNALKFQTVLVRNKLLGGYLLSEADLLDLEESVKSDQQSLSWRLM
jgi:hypothetical protein